MKNRILTFIIGMLVGAIIIMAIFYGYLKSGDNQFKENKFEMNMPDRQGQNGEVRPQFGDFDRENPPEKPSGENNFNRNKI